MRDVTHEGTEDVRSFSLERRLAPFALRSRFFTDWFLSQQDCLGVDECGRSKPHPRAAKMEAWLSLRISRVAKTTLDSMFVLEGS